MSDSVRPHGWQPIRLPRPWDSPGKNTGVGCQEVDQLKMAVYSGGQAAQHRLPAVPAGPVHEVSEAREPEPYDEADWQEPDMQEQSPSEGPDLSLQKVSEDLIQKALEKHGGNRKLAAAELGISERTLYRRLAKETKR